MTDEVQSNTAAETATVEAVVPDPTIVPASLESGGTGTTEADVQPVPPIKAEAKETFMQWAHDEEGKIIRTADEMIAWVREHVL